MEQDLTKEITVTVNGEIVRQRVEPRLSLADWLRDRLGLTATHLGCEMGACGACLVMLNGRPAHACLTLAVQVDGEIVETLEGLRDRGVIADLQSAFHERNALQCGFCTSGMLATAHALLVDNPHPDRSEIRDALSGNYCRCTGYEAIVDAIASTATARTIDQGTSG
nr:(2Fe-2S)-binding protein [uncultured Rhizobium sp.]